MIKMNMLRQHIIDSISVRPMTLDNVIDYQKENTNGWYIPNGNQFQYVAKHHFDVQLVEDRGQINKNVYGLRSRIIENWDNEDYLSNEQKNNIIDRSNIYSNNPEIITKNFERTFLEQIINLENRLNIEEE